MSAANAPAGRGEARAVNCGALSPYGAPVRSPRLRTPAKPAADPVEEDAPTLGLDDRERVEGDPPPSTRVIKSPSPSRRQAPEERGKPVGDHPVIVSRGVPVTSEEVQSRLIEEPVADAAVAGVVARFDHLSNMLGVSVESDGHERRERGLIELDRVGLLN
ncbi:hypothetical protein ACWDPI_21285, partial [Streptomyces zhihengii]